jgi:type VI secretion system secreted protein Hcp
MAADTFARLGDIKGESVDDKHKDEIEVLSWSWGVTNAFPAAGSGAGGNATFKDLTIVHNVDKASPALMLACATGRHLTDGTITERKAGKVQQEFLVIKMNDVVITSVTHGPSTDSPLSEAVTLTFAKIDLQYNPIKVDGSLDAGIHFKFDLKQNKEG